MAKQPSLIGPLAFLVLVFVGAVWAAQFISPRNVTLPAPLPELKVEGWINTAQPIETKELAGKWVLVDFWRTDCPPCLFMMPELVDLREEWEDQGLVVIGITNESAESLPVVEKVVEEIEGFTWPVAYGGGELFAQFRVTGIPHTVLFNPQGEQVWRGHPGKLPHALHEHITMNASN